MPVDEPVRALVVGSSVIDRPYYVDSLPSDGEVALATAGGMYFGGKGANQAIALHRLGVSVTFVTAVGDDPDGAAIRRFLECEGLDVRASITPAPTGAAVPIISRTSKCFVVAAGANLQLPEDALATIDPSSFDGVLVQQELPVGVVGRIAEAPHRLKVLNAAPVLDIGRDARSQFQAVICNEAEARALTGEDGALEQLAAGLAEAHPAQLCVVTGGPKGAVAAMDARRWTQEPLPTEQIDSTGAGDAFCAALLYSLMRNWPVDVGLLVAAAAGSWACEHLGAVPSMPSFSDIMGRVERSPHVDDELRATVVNLAGERTRE